MDLIDVIKSCTTVEEIEVMEWVFDFDERHREAALWHRIILWANNMELGSGNREAWSMSGAIDELDGTAARMVL